MISPVGTWKLLSFQYEFEDSDHVTNIKCQSGRCQHLHLTLTVGR